MRKPLSRARPRLSRQHEQNLVENPVPSPSDLIRVIPTQIVAVGIVDYIQPVENRNVGLKVTNLLGINLTKNFMP